jgi:hypothetical protein
LSVVSSCWRDYFGGLGHLLSESGAI